MGATEIIPENEITIENLAGLFKRAFFSTSLDDDGDLAVKTDGLLIYIAVEKNHKLLKYMTTFGVKETAPAELKYAFVNKMNDEVLLARFSIPEGFPNTLIADYFIPFEEGIPAFQIVSALRLFTRAVSFAIDKYDDKGLVS